MPSGIAGPYAGAGGGWHGFGGCRRAVFPFWGRSSDTLLNVLNLSIACCIHNLQYFIEVTKSSLESYLYTVCSPSELWVAPTCGLLPREWAGTRGPAVGRPDGPEALALHLVHPSLP